jgi:hypothetical protein
MIGLQQLQQEFYLVQIIITLVVVVEVLELVLLEQIMVALVVKVVALLE